MVEIIKNTQKNQVVEYILPLYEIAPLSYNNILINAYLKMTDNGDFKYNVVIFFKSVPKINYFIKNKYFISDGKMEDDQTYMVEMALPKEHKTSIEKILDSKYSEIDVEDVKIIIINSIYQFYWAAYYDKNNNEITKEEYTTRQKKGEKCSSVHNKREALWGLYAPIELKKKIAERLEVNIDDLPKETIQKFKSNNFYHNILDKKEVSINFRTEIDKIDNRIADIKKELLILTQKKNELLK